MAVPPLSILLDGDRVMRDAPNEIAFQTLNIYRLPLKPADHWVLLSISLNDRPL